MSPAIDRLALQVGEAWARAGHTDEAFPAIAAEALSRPLDLGLAALARQVCGGARLPAQRRMDLGFGQPAITLFHSERFLIEALCWHSGSPAIHQHAFSGAFRVLTGRSVHGVYSFFPRERFGPFEFGELRLEEIDILDQHTTVPIHRGRRLIHSAFHLDSPSMTVVVRTPQSDQQELTYLPPGVAYDPSARSLDLHKRLQLLDTLNITRHELYAECVHASIESGDLYDGMAVLIRVGSHGHDESTFLGFATRFVARHGPRAAPIVQALIEERRRGILLRMRAAFSDEHTRFFLACLLNFSRRSELMEAMTKRYGDPSVARERICQEVGRILGGDPERQVLSAIATDAILEEVPPAAFADRVGHLCCRELTPVERSKSTTFYENLRKHELIAPLVSDDTCDVARILATGNT